MVGPFPQYDKLYSCFVRPKNKRLGYEETARILHGVGFRGWNLVVAVALTRPESAGDPQAYLAYVVLPRNPVANAAAHVALSVASRSRVTVTTFRHLARKLGARLVSADIGLCQINWWWRQDRISMHGLTDPVVNATWAHRISGGQNFSPWAAYNS
jgi:hypothetical protein